MKTPREILLARHKAVEPKLDELRQSAVAAVYDRRSLSQPAPSILQLLWHELFLPSRRVWSSLAAVWIVILAVNFSMRDQSGTNMAKSTSPEMVQTFKQREQLLAQLIGPNDAPAAEPQKSYTPRPSSLRLSEILTA
jgi:hypothetical protein